MNNRLLKVVAIQPCHCDFVFDVIIKRRQGVTTTATKEESPSFVNKKETTLIVASYDDVL
jgi:hypothetical protein